MPMCHCSRTVFGQNVQAVGGNPETAEVAVAASTATRIGALMVSSVCVSTVARRLVQR